MKLLTKTSSIFLFSSLQAAFAGDVRVNVSGLETQTGQIGCSLHSSSTEFPMGHVGTVQVWVKPSGNTAKCTFSDVPAGTYAVAVAHDLNGNKKTDTNTFAPNAARATLCGSCVQGRSGTCFS